MAEEQNSPNMQDDPQATQHIEPAEPTHDDASVARTEPIAPVREPEGDIAQTKTFETTQEPASAAPAAASAEAPAQSTEQPAAPAYGQYRPAPEYGAYGPAPTQPIPSQNAPTQPTQQTQPIQQGQPVQQNPNNGNPFGMPNPFAARSNQQQGNQGQPNQQMPNGQPTQRFGIFGGPVPPVPPQNGQNGQNGQPNMPGQQPNGKKNNSTTTTVLTAVIAAALSAALCLGLGYAAITSGAVKVPTTSSMANINSSESGSGSATAKTGEAPDWQAVAKEVSGSVVAIQATLSNGVAKGSGAILDTEGNIVTNNHVISGAQKILVTLSNGQMYSANVVGTDTTTDLAVIKLENPPSDLKAVKFANSDKLAVGENVMAVGNPLGYDDTATTGIVSALNRPVTVMDDDNNNIVTNAVQIDAAINPGNSGGPTFNAAGEVIGINSSIATAGSSDSSSSSSGSIGIGFAIPSNLVKRVADEIVKDGSVKHVALGVTVKTDTVEADGVTRAGARITSSSTGNAVVKGGPADKAGLKSGDTIVAFDGHAVNSTASLLGFVRAAALGDKATLTIVRDGKTMDVDVTLDQQEDKVNGSNRTESNSQRNQSQNDQNDQNQYQYQNGDGSDGSGDSDGSSGSNGFPFNLW
ncbi:trypsin-like peptidase domain-containing protein [Bifidobacterium sp. 64T4]|uniref:S1C family serine protease n=1 Tax=Bifidobacterium pongonis TaxID=2834432 RepID=UPI001C5878F0|nr:trypsin-like peptidase domain-containing protein [Bifidobacterium pongonis]MBW3094387.1 trypsin-like peptidase domain-containing protein [Bifidobacterium pongonis]